MERPKRMIFASAVLLLSGFLIFPIPDRIFVGEIMDSVCAHEGSHAIAARNIETERDCTIGCVEAGAKYVLYNERGRATFQLDNQQRPREFAGERVVVVGSYERLTNTIHVREIQRMYTNTMNGRAWTALGYLGFGW